VSRGLLSLFLGLLLVASIATPSEPEQKTITVASDTWEGATYDDGSGFYFNLLRKIYEPLGYTLDIKILPYKRSVQTVIKGEADVWLGAYKNEVEEAIYPNWHMDIEQVSALLLASKNISIQNINDLGEQRIAWIRGYGYQKVLKPSQPMHWSEVSNIQSGFSMVEKERVDIYLDAQYELNNYMEGLPEKEKIIYKINTLKTLKLYPGFNISKRGEKLAAEWDQRMQNMAVDGNLEQFYKTEGYEEYVF